jgi:cystathionine beta-lyase/cystathionine gamma-synthase
MNNFEEGFGPPETIVAHDERHFGDAVVPPIFQTSLFTFSSYEEMEAVFSGKRARPVYSRGLNPTVRAFEEKVAQLEGAEDALGFGSGMAAISSSVLAFVRPGDRILSVEHVYPDSFRFFETVLNKLGVGVGLCRWIRSGRGRGHAAGTQGALSGKPDQLDVPGARSPSACPPRPLPRSGQHRRQQLGEPDIPNPIALGCDLSLHSASKYLGGHSDVVAGVVAGRGELIGKLRREILPYLGGKLSPFDSWLLLRGLRTLPARMREHERSALELARRLQDHPAVTVIHHPAFRDTAPKGLKGTSGLFSVELHPAIDIPGFCNALRIFRIGVSWGGHESLICPACRHTCPNRRPQPRQALRRAGADGAPQYRAGISGLSLV